MGFYIEPLGDRLFARRLEREEVTEGGLVLPENTEQQNKLNEAEVLSVGPDVQKVKAGEHVLIGQYAGTDVVLGGETFIVLREEEVMGVLREQDFTRAEPGPVEMVDFDPVDKEEP